MKKKIIAIVAVFAVIALMFVAYGCGKSNLEPETPIVTSASAAKSQLSGFEFELISEQKISNFQTISYWRETSTDTMYIESWRHHNYGSGSGLTQMLDPETGKPLTYTQWLESYQ